MDTSVTDKLISPPRTSDTGTPLSENKIPKGENLEDLISKSPSKPHEGLSVIRFGPNREDNPFQSSSRNQVSILSTFPT